MENNDSGYPRLEEQIAWYDNKSISAKKWYKNSKLVEVCAAALIPFVVGMSVTVTALLGILIAILEGLQHLNQWAQNWVSYRSTCESLRHEKYLYMGRADSYAGLSDEEALRLLTERVESMVSTEHAKWSSRQLTKKQDGKSSG